MNVDSYQIIKNWLPRFIIVSTILLVAIGVFFIYKNVWQVFASSKSSASLQETIVPVELKLDLFKKIEENFKNKSSPEESLDLAGLKNPFGAPGQKEEKIELR